MAKLSEAEPVEVRMRGLRVAQLLDKRFLGILEQELSGASAAHVCIFIPGEEEDDYSIVMFGHRKLADEKERIFNIDASNPENLTAALKALELYLKEE